MDMSELLADLARNVLLARRTAALQEMFELLTGEEPDAVRLIGYGAIGCLELDENTDWGWQLKKAAETMGYVINRVLINVQHRSIADEVEDGIVVDYGVPGLIAACGLGEWFIGFWTPFCLLKWRDELEPFEG